MTERVENQAPMARGELPRRVRAWLSEQAEPRWPHEVADGIGLPGDIRVTWCLLRMKREGMCEAHGDGVHKQYSLLRDAHVAYTPEQRIAARRATDRNRYRRKVGLLPPKPAKPDRPKPPKPSKSAICIPPPTSRPFVKPKPVQEKDETVEAWMQRTGRKPEVIPPVWERR